MATRARIGIQLADGSVLSAYHHWDGYPEWLGRILRTHYNTKEQVSELIDGGDMSCCWTDERWGTEEKASEYGPNYYSYRGDECPPRIDASRYQYLNNGEEYAYLFVNDEWLCWNLHQFGENQTPDFVQIPSGDLAV